MCGANATPRSKGSKPDRAGGFTVKLVMTLVVRDEADIIAANLDYHLANGVDFVLVTDHGSSDGTSEILHEYERAGAARVIRDEEEGHHQSRRVTRMAELAYRELRASWLIHNDADEFWWPVLGSLRDVFASIPDRYAQVVVPRRNFRPLADSPGPDAESFHQQLLYREFDSSQLGDTPKVAHRPVAGIRVAPGNHSLSPELPCMPASGLLEIMHFPMRSYEQFERKVMKIGLGYERVEDRSPGVGSEQLMQLALAREGRLREHYESHALDRGSLQRGLSDGTIVLDRRLADFMRDVPTTRAEAHRASEPHAQKLVAELMRLLVTAEDSRQALEELRLDNQRLTGELEILHKRLEQASDELASANHALNLLRTSKVLRYTAWARRLYYRLSSASHDTTSG
ncbi:MAG: glycosyltransferase family 2 protein [Solirubrobacteraceae bacterium]